MSAQESAGNRAIRAVTDIKSGKNATSLLLIGNRGTQMMKDAETMASFLLGVEEKALSSHPDFFLVRKAEDEKTIGVEMAEEIIHTSLSMPSVSDIKVILIDGMNDLTIQAQNKLLKIIEESKHVILIGVAYEDTLLPTIKSRMRVITYRPLSFTAYRRVLEEAVEACDDLLVRYYAACGIPGEAPDAEVEGIFREVKAALTGKDKSLLFKAFCMVKEKDSNAFFLNHRAYVPNALSLMGDVVTGMTLERPTDHRLYACASLLAKHRADCGHLWYTKDSFFSCVAQVVELLRKKEEKDVTIQRTPSLDA